MSHTAMPFSQSKPVIVIPHKDSWQDEFSLIQASLWKVVGDSALRVDHIGSTSVPGLAAKDIIDVQVTLADIDQADDFIARMVSAGYHMRGDIRFDCLDGENETPTDELKKRYFREAEGQRRTHIHVRQLGKLNQVYPLLFRDFLRNNADMRANYGLLKQRLAALFPEQIEGYLYIKDPLMDMIYHAAQLWAKQTHWSQ